MKFYADMVGGAAGDMILGAMLDCGLPLKLLRDELNKLNLPGLEIQTERVKRSGVECLKLNVITPTEKYHRTFAIIRDMIQNSSLSHRVKESSLKIFLKLAEAEGEIHGIDPEKVHFHEVGAADSIADIVGIAVGMEYFAVGGFYLSEFKLGSGITKSSHGEIPIPAPATLKLIKGHLFKKLPVESELTTPTGAAVLSALSCGYMPDVPLKYKAVGYGAGSRQIEGIPGYLRLWLIEDDVHEDSQEIVIEANIDDMNPEAVPYIIEKLFQSGAKDVFFTHVVMKKGRPGINFTITAEKNALENVSMELFRQSTTIGLRWYNVNRIKLERGMTELKTKWGIIKAKWVNIAGNKRIIPEFEECKRIADENNVPLLDVYRKIDSLTFEE